jgi:hypothetical protein
MGDLPAAGRYWFLTEDSGGSEAEAAREAFARRCGGSAVQMLRDLPVRPPLDPYPPPVRERVRSLVEAARNDGYDWDASVRRLSEPRPESPPSRGIPLWPLVLVLLLLIVGVWVLGWVFIVTRFV